MAKLRKGCTYRRLERPYTRHSKYRKKSFVRVKPNILIVKFDMGDPSKEFPHKFRLLSKNHLQIRHNALEAARQTCNRALEKGCGKGNYHLKIKVYPHHILRENPLASGAGADRMSTGMKKSFGKIIGCAARIREGQTILEVRCDKEHIPIAKLALKRGSQKFACTCSIVEVLK